MKNIPVYFLLIMFSCVITLTLVGYEIFKQQAENAKTIASYKCTCFDDTEMDDA
ncbi:hypothetical protein UFOVP23_6 [uncultured Caudovirales phage]|uniref:Uncharacterized protein n=1 Tax=uncultured Caudovirales phage TaxID=2100421 RepID=A0A6J5TA66_9CAUD|nr:hypothetical protein UFOVP23_6 [uncultured Caudovirales phage]